MLEIATHRQTFERYSASKERGMSVILCRVASESKRVNPYYGTPKKVS